MTLARKLSKQPLSDIAKVSYEGQPEHMKMYREGYEHFMQEIPILQDDDILLKQKLNYANAVLGQLTTELKQEPWIYTGLPSAGEFNRTIIAIEEPEWKWTTGGTPFLIEKPELVVSKWGEGFTSPPHGHSAGLLYEQVVFGTIRVDSYQVVDKEKRIVRPLMTEIVKDGQIATSGYTKQEAEKLHGKRSAIPHSFTAISKSVMLHYVPEHTRDNRDNAYTVEYFSVQEGEFEQLTPMQAYYLKIGEVLLVRSSNVPEYGDHFIVITGAPSLTDHGLRPHTITMSAPNMKELLDKQENNGVVLLHLKPNARERFYQFHNMDIQDKKVVIPEKV